MSNKKRGNLRVYEVPPQKLEFTLRSAKGLRRTAADPVNRLPDGGSNQPEIEDNRRYGG
jgi:hypothetical protein